MMNFLKPAPAKPYLSDGKVDKVYKKLRVQVLISIFVGYAAYYLVRKNFALAMPYLINEGLDSGKLGFAAAVLPFSYGISKFFMGVISDRSNPRIFLPIGLILSGITSILLGSTYNLTLITILMFLNGWFQGMGWPACGRVMSHWFSDGERGMKMSIWNVSHNLAGGVGISIASIGIMIFGTWRSLFYFPAIIVIFVGIGCLIFLRDTPQSCGLPPIEEYKNDYPDIQVDDLERELGAKEILFKYVLSNKYLWYLAIANIFVYTVRYGILDWCTVYLTTVKGAPQWLSRWCYSLYEYAGIPGILISGWLSDNYFKGRRGPVSTICMTFVTLTILVYWMNPADNYTVDVIALLLTGCLIYVPVVLVGIAAIDLVPKKAAGTAAGFTGFFGYFFGTAAADWAIGIALQYSGWTWVFMMLITACVLGTLFLGLTWNIHDREKFLEEDDYIE